MADKDDVRIRTELIRLKFGILEKYEAQTPDTQSIGDALAPFCDFCGKARNEVDGMVGNGTGCLYICNECVLKANEILFGMPQNQGL